MRRASIPAGKGATGRMANCLLILLVVAASRVWAGGPVFDFHTPASVDDAAAGAAMRDLAARLVPVYQDPDPDRYLANLSVLQMVAGNYSAAYETRQTLRDRRRRLNAGRPVGRDVILDMYARAKAMEAQTGGVTFAEGFTQAYQDVVPQ